MYAIAAKTNPTTVKAFLLLVRWAYVMAVTFSVGYLTVHFGRRTDWYKGHLYQQLVSGDAERRLYAAGALALVGGERQLLAGDAKHLRRTFGWLFAVSVAICLKAGA